MPKSWTEKYNSDKKPQVKTLEKRFADLPEGCKMFIATPKIIDAYVREIPFGASVDLKTTRKDLAIEHFADNTCPVTTSIFLRIASEASLEQNNQDNLLPFWRVVNQQIPIAKKLSCGVDFINEQRKKEGING